MPSLTPVLSVLRHALADPLSAATAKAEVLAARLRREQSALAARAEDLGADLATAGRLLDLLSALSEISEEAPETVPLERLASPSAVGSPSSAGTVRVRPASAAGALRRVVAFGAARGGTVRVALRRNAGRGEVLLEGLGPRPEVPIEQLLLLPRAVAGADDLFLARAAALADGGALVLSLGDEGLRATFSWPLAAE